jgi:hypothetical protein
VSKPFDFHAAAVDDAVEEERRRCIADLCERCARGEDLAIGISSGALFHDAANSVRVTCPAEPIHRRVRG